MKKLIAATIIIAACAALCAPVWPQTGAGEKVPTAEVKMRTTPVYAEVLAEQQEQSAVTLLPAKASAPMAEKEEAAVNETSTIPEPTKAPEQEARPIAAEVNVLVPMPTAPPATSPSDADPYHTDVYPENVYSEELIYDEDGNLIGKTTTIPTAFDSDTIWIDGHAYYDLPGFGLIEWSGPGQRTEAYTMYESGVKVGIMGGEDEAATVHAAQSQPQDWPEPPGEVIDQTINTVPERGSMPPNYKPTSTPPDDPNARIAPDSDLCGEE